MALPMRSTDFRSIVEPILNEEFDGIYDQRADEWQQFMKEETGTPRSYHEEPVLYGFGAAPELPDGMPVTYQSGGVLFIQRYIYRVYGLAFALTKVLVEDGDHIKIGQLYSRHLAQSMIETKETLAAREVTLEEKRLENATVFVAVIPSSATRSYTAYVIQAFDAGGAPALPVPY